MKTILIPFTIQFTVRYVLRTGVLEEILKTHKVIIILFWNEPELIVELENLGCKVIVGKQPNFSRRLNFLSKLIGLFFKKNVASPSFEIDKKRNDLLHGKKSFKLKTIEFIQNSLLYLPLSKIIINKYFARDVIKDETYQFFKIILETNNVDIVWSITGFLKHEFVLLQAANDLKIKRIGSILSFDNVTTRGWLFLDFNYYFVWNEYNKQEILRVQKTATSQNIIITGAPQFDFYYKEEFFWEKNYWLNKLQLPIDRPIILFGGGHCLIAPGEENWLKEIDDAITNGEIRNHPIILFRIHPNDSIERWTKTLKSAKNVVFDNPWQANADNPGQTNIDNYSISKLVSTLKHSDVHINTSSTLTLDGAAFNKPQIGPAYDSLGRIEFDEIIKDLYKREHFLPIVESKGLQLAFSRIDLIDLINDAIIMPNKFVKERNEMLNLITTNLDGKASERLVMAINNI